MVRELLLNPTMGLERQEERGSPWMLSMVLKNISLLPKSLILSEGWLQWNPSPCPRGRIFSLLSPPKRRRGSEESAKQGGQMISKVKQKGNVRDPLWSFLKWIRGVVWYLPALPLTFRWAFGFCQVSKLCFF